MCTGTVYRLQVLCQGLQGARTLGLSTIPLSQKLHSDSSARKFHTLINPIYSNKTNLVQCLL